MCKLVFQDEAKNIPRQVFVMKNISCKFENSTYNTVSSRASKCVKVLADHHLVLENEASLKVKYLEAIEDIYLLKISTMKTFNLP